MHRRFDRNHTAGRRIVWSRWVVCVVIALAGVVTSLAPAEMAIARTRRRHGFTPQIINGTPVPPGQDRFVVALLDTSRGSMQFDQQFCGGALITRRHVLTAAHCMASIQVDNLKVLVDQVELDAGGQPFAVASIAIHPDADPNNISPDDAAVLTLAKPLPRRVGQRIALPKANDVSHEQAGDPGTIAGWGNTSASGIDYPTHMMQADVAFVADSTCATAYPEFDAPSMVCAAGENPARDSCQGDSGGPLFATGAKHKRIQVGIVSWGRGCAQPGLLGVYTRLSDPAITNWIHGVTAKHGSKKGRHG